MMMTFALPFEGVVIGVEGDPIGVVVAGVLGIAGLPLDVIIGCCAGAAELGVFDVLGVLGVLGALAGVLLGCAPPLLAAGVIAAAACGVLVAGVLGGVAGATGAAEPAAALTPSTGGGDSASPQPTTPAATTVPPTTRMKSRRPSVLSDLSIVDSPRVRLRAQNRQFARSERVLRRKESEIDIATHDGYRTPNYCGGSPGRGTYSRGGPMNAGCAGAVGAVMGSLAPVSLFGYAPWMGGGLPVSR
jgi:hypothetical protein